MPIQPVGLHRESCGGCSSVAHLSRTFKQVTGMTPTQYREVSGERLPLDKV
ncbi:MAG: AraC family transcriptional regulator [Bacteroidales bacterium]|nr:AraC family transcriptional regulator [Bacteroidales bacterium]